MDASALESEIKSLETRSDSLEKRLSVSISVVVIGVVLEFFMVLLKHYWPGSLDWWWVELIGPGLVGIGVASELAIHVLAGRVNAGLKTAKVYRSHSVRLIRANHFFLFAFCSDWVDNNICTQPASPVLSGQYAGLRAFFFPADQIRIHPTAVFVQ